MSEDEYDDLISLAQPRAAQFHAQAVGRSLAAQLDILLAPLVAEGGTLEHQADAYGVDRYYVNGTLRLVLGRAVCEEGPPGHLTFSRTIERFDPTPEVRELTGDEANDAWDAATRPGAL